MCKANILNLHCLHSFLLASSLLCPCLCLHIDILLHILAILGLLSLLDLDHRPPRSFSLSSSFLLSLVCTLSCLSVCVNAALASSAFAWPLLFPGLRGGEEVMWLRSYDTWSCSMSSCVHPLHFCSTVYILVIIIVYTVIFCLFCAHNIYFMSVHPGRVTSVAFPEVSSIFFPVKGFSWGEFFLIRFEGLRTEGVICCTDCIAPWSEWWFMILGCINKTD